MVRRLGLVAALTILLSVTASDLARSGARTSASKPSANTPASSPKCTAKTVGGKRPTAVHVPSTYRCTRPAPLVIALHGFTGSGASIGQYLRLAAESKRLGFLYLTPDGVKDPAGQSFWNATPACCNFRNVPVDDSAYLSGLITETQALYRVDPKRVFVVGYSNGGFMAYRMACEHSDQIAAIASLAGAMRIDPAACRPSQKVSVLQIHGSSDSTIAYAGGSILGNDFPGASTSVASWAAINGCASKPAKTTASFDFDASVAGKEASIAVYPSCAAGTAAELWTLNGSSHSPDLTPALTAAVFDFLVAHPKP